MFFCFFVFLFFAKNKNNCVLFKIFWILQIFQKFIVKFIEKSIAKFFSPIKQKQKQTHKTQTQNRMIGHTEALAQQDDNAMDIDEEIISVEILESLGVNTGDGTLLHSFFSLFFVFFSRRQIEFCLKLTLFLSFPFSLSSSLLSFPSQKIT